MLHLNVNIHLHAVPNCFANFWWKRLRRMANPLQLSKTLVVLIASCNCTYIYIWSAGPHSFLVNIQNVSKGRALHWNVAFIPNCSCKFYKESLEAQGQPAATLKDFACSDCFWQLHIWSAGPHSFLVNIRNISKGRTELECCTQTLICMLPNCSANSWRKRLRRMANPLQLSKTLAVLIASGSCTYRQLVPIHSL